MVKTILYKAIYKVKFDNQQLTIGIANDEINFYKKLGFSSKVLSLQIIIFRFLSIFKMDIQIRFFYEVVYRVL